MRSMPAGASQGREDLFLVRTVGEVAARVERISPERSMAITEDRHAILRVPQAEPLHELPARVAGEREG